MTAYRETVSSVILPVLILLLFSSCESGSGEVDTTGLSHVKLQIDGMT